MIQSTTQGFPGGTSDKEFAYRNRRHKRLGFNPWRERPGGVTQHARALLFLKGALSSSLHLSV